MTNEQLELNQQSEPKTTDTSYVNVDLQYSESTLLKRVKSIKYRNIQGAKNLTLEFPKSGVIRLNAPSEVGKSSLFKPLEPLVLPTFRDTDELSSLISKDATTGDVLVETYADDQVWLHLDSTSLKNCEYRVKYKDKPIQTYPFDTVPDAVIDILGWFVSLIISSSPYCMNLRLSPPYSLIGTHGRLNSEIFNVSLNDEPLNQAIKEVNRAKSEAENLSQQLQIALNSVSCTMKMPIDDTETLQNELFVLENIRTQYATLLKLQDALSHLYTNVSTLPKKVEVDPSLKTHIENYKSMCQLSFCLQALLQSCEPLTHTSYKLDDLKTLIKQYNDLTTLKVLTENLAQIEATPLEKKDFTLLKDYLKEGIAYQKLAKTIQAMQSNLQEQQLLKSRLDLTQLTKLQVTLSKLELVKQQMKSITNELARIEKEKSKYICPTCKQFYINCKY